MLCRKVREWHGRDVSPGARRMDAASEGGSIGAEQGLHPQTANRLSTPRQVLLWRMAVVVADDDPATSASLDKIFSC
jgi:hypothetical protein